MASSKNKSKDMEYSDSNYIIPGGPVIRYGGTGLEYLNSIQTVKITQVLHWEEIIIGWEQNNVYRICDKNGKEFMSAIEETDCMSRQCCGSIRALKINFKTLEGQIPIQISRSLRCQGCLFPCFMQIMDICSPPGNKIATIKEVLEFVNIML